MGSIFYEDTKVIFKYLKPCGMGRHNDQTVYIIGRQFGVQLRIEGFQHLKTIKMK